MNKTEFLFELGQCLVGLPKDDITEKLSFYSEMIDDRIEDGVSEEDAVAGLGSPEKIAEEIIKDYPLTKLVKEKVKPKRQIKAWEIVLLVLGAPIWLTLGIVLLSVVFTLYAVMWSLVAVAWAVFGTFVACGIGFVVGGIITIACGGAVSGILLIALGLVLSGVSIFIFFGCGAVTDGMAWLTKKIALGVKRLFIGKGDAK